VCAQEGDPRRDPGGPVADSVGGWVDIGCREVTKDGRMPSWQGNKYADAYHAFHAGPRHPWYGFPVRYGDDVANWQRSPGAGDGGFADCKTGVTC